MGLLRHDYNCARRAVPKIRNAREGRRIAASMKRRYVRAIALILLLTILAWMAATVTHVQRDDVSALDAEDDDPPEPDPCRTFITVEHMLPYHQEQTKPNPLP